MLRGTVTTQNHWHKLFDEVVSGANTTAIQICTRLIDKIRKSGARERYTNFEDLCVYLEENTLHASIISDAVCELVSHSDLTRLLTESGVQSSDGFAAELKNRFVQRMVPELEDPNDLRTHLRTVFHKDNDYKWVSAVPPMLWDRLMKAIGIGERKVFAPTEEWASSLRILSHHVASLGLQPEITHRLPYLEGTDSPFLQLPDAILCFTKMVEERQHDVADSSCLQRVLAALASCQEAVERLRSEKSLYGTSLRLTSLSFRLFQLLSRLEMLIKLTVSNNKDFRSLLIQLLHQVVEAENTRNHIIPHVKKSGDLLAYQVVEHAAKKGSKYITSGWKDYWKFYAASLGGGLIVAIFAVIKLLLKDTGLPLGVEALIFGINYSLCFVIIYLTGSALATKQPAMTANTLARSLARDETGLQLNRLEDLIVQVWRSQFISFVGNLMMALPVAFILSVAYHQFTGTTVVDQATSVGLLEGILPGGSGALIYAAIAGLFLFMSGLVAGWVDNQNLYMKYPARLAHHPWLIKLIGETRAQRVGAFIDRNMGIMAGNVFLGFCLGSTASVGEILGLPIDIRHIAFSSAEYGVSLEVLGSTVPSGLVVNAAYGVILIGLINFLVSFGLSLVMALESRQVQFNETRRLIGRLIKRLFRRPFDWFFPPRT